MSYVDNLMPVVKENIETGTITASSGHRLVALEDSSITVTWSELIKIL